MIVDTAPSDIHILTARRLGIDTQNESVIFLRQDSHVSRAEGFLAHARIAVRHNAKVINATLYQVTSDLLHHNEAGLSEAAWHRLGLSDGAAISVGHSPIVESLTAVRGKVYGHPFDEASIRGA